MVSDPRARGIAELMLDVRTSFHQPLSASILWKWQDLIIQDPYQRQHLEVGGWRTNPSPMQIVSGAIGKETIFFEAPPSSQVPKEMDHFIKWFNQTDPAVVGKNHLHGVVRAAISHLYFESIHPFADGNGRIGRAIAEKALSQDLGLPVFLTLSKIIYQKRKSYYQELSKASAYTVDLTEWVFFFITCVLEAQIDAKETFLFVIKKTKFWKRYQSILNERQTKVVRRIMEEGKAGFKGGMTPKKYMILTDCSKATATRDLSDLFKKGCFVKSEEEGRSTFYNINLNSTSTSF